MTWLKRIGKLIIFTFILGLISLSGFYFYIEDELPDEATIRDVRFQIPMKVYTADGELISQFGEKRRTPLLYKEIPQQLIDAIIATEDARFYDHIGFDPIGIVRAAFISIMQGRKAQGASTITMQLARNVFLTFDKTLIRKVKELYIALHLEKLLTKQEILTLYLNKIYFGNRAYGIGAAAQVYYGKDINELTLPQLAMIAGLPKAPSLFNPIRNKEKAKWRRNVVLGRMLAVGAIDKTTYNQAVQAPVTAERHGAQITAYAPYVAEEIRKFMVDKYGKETAYTEGFNVYTTIQAKTQLSAQKAVKNNIHAYDERHGYRGPIRYLWNEANVDNTIKEHAAWSQQKISDYLQNINDYDELVPAVVTNVTDKSVYTQLKDDTTEVIEWDNLSWAREYIDDNKQGSPPQNAQDILTAGALVWLRPLPDGRFRLSQIPQVTGSFIALDPNNGDIKAMVGGYNFTKNQFNRVTQAERQVGSNIKPFIYSAALENGSTLATLINDAPINKWDRKLGTAWRPENSPPTYGGPTRVRRGLAESKNVMAVRLLRSLGVEKAVNHLTRFGFEQNKLPKNESLSLGSATLTPLSVATGMSVFANGGFLIEPQLVDRVENTIGEIVYQPTKLTVNKSSNLDENTDLTMLAPRVLSKANAFLIAESMKSTVWGGGNWTHGTGWNGTAWRAQRLKRQDISGKTGTTNKSVDTWFTGFTPNILATAWVGFDAPGRSLGRAAYNTNLPDPQLVGSESGAISALPAWIEFMEEILPDIPVSYPEIPEGIVSVRIDLETGLLTRKTDHTTRFEYFIKGTEPKEYAETSPPNTIGENDMIEEEEEIF